MKNTIIIGIDPDSKAHGAAVYIDGELDTLESIDLFLISHKLKILGYSKKDICVHIENVCGMNAVFRQRQSKNAAISMKMSNSVGKCQQAQIEVERICEHLGVKVIRRKISKMWKKDKKQFQLVTGWKGRSNEDTRSAAYFGWLGINSSPNIKY